MRYVKRTAKHNSQPAQQRPAISRAIRSTLETLERRTLFSVPVAGAVPALSSNPAAHVKLYLDFDGDAATTWNGFPVPATPAYDTDGDPTTFNNAGDNNLHTELDNIRQIWSWVSEKFSPFNIDVTTVNPGSFPDGGALHMVVGGDGTWFFSSGGLPGASNTGAFYNSSYSNNAYMYSVNFGGTVSWVANAIAYEAGNSFGLENQSVYNDLGTKTLQFNPGNSLIGPIMGDPSRSARGTWWYGTSGIYDFNFTTQRNVPRMQDDLAVLSGSLDGFGYRPDGSNTSIATATALTGTGGSFSGSGIIERTSDSDYFSFTTTGGQVTINGNVAQFGAMLDLKLTLLNSAGQTIATADSASLGEAITANLAAGTYYIAVGSHGAYGDLGQYTLSVSAPSTSPAPTVPTAPTGLSAQAASASQINLVWADVSSDETGFVIERATDASFTQGMSTTTLGANATSFSATGLAAGTTYYFRVHAFNGVGNSGNSNSTFATTLTLPPPPPPPTVPAAPTGLQTTGVSGAVSVGWTDMSNNETGFMLQRSTDGGASWSNLASVGVNVATFTDASISAGMTYSYRVYAYGTAGNSTTSNMASILAIPTAPTSLSAATMSASQIQLNWADTSGETGYRVERSTGGTGWGTVVTLGANAVSFSDFTLLAGTTYSYRVFAIGPSGSSVASNTASATTSTTPVQVGPPAPSNLSVTRVSRKQNRITWADNSSNETSFLLQYSTDGGATWRALATLPSSTTTYTHQFKSGGAGYVYRVAAVNSVAQSSWVY